MVRISKTWAIVKCRYGHVIWNMKYYYMIRSYGRLYVFHSLPSIFSHGFSDSPMALFNVSPVQNSQRNQGADRSNQSSLCSASLLLERPFQRPDGLQRLQTLAFFALENAGSLPETNVTSWKSTFKGRYIFSSMFVFLASVMLVFEGVRIP